MTEDTRIPDYDTPAPPARPKAMPPGYWLTLYKPGYAEVASRLAAVGFNCNDIAYSFGVPVAAVENWKTSVPEFKAVWRNGKLDQLKRMAAKAMLEAVGYDYQTSKTEVSRDADGEIKGTKHTVFQNHQSPQPNMLIFLLCNLSSQLGLDNDQAWKSRQKMEIETKSINLTISGELVSAQIAKLAGKLLGEPETKQIETIEATFEPVGLPDGSTIAQDGQQDANGCGSEPQDAGGADEPQGGLQDAGGQA